MKGYPAACSRQPDAARGGACCPLRPTIMTQTILSLAALVGSVVAGQPAAEPTALTGSVTYYNPGIMEATYRLRLQWGHVAPCAIGSGADACVGMIALLDRAYLGRRVWLRRPGHPVEGPFLVVDCAAGKDRERLRKRGLVAEVDWPTARRWRMAGPVAGVIVHFADPTLPEVRSYANTRVNNLSYLHRN